MHEQPTASQLAADHAAHSDPGPRATEAAVMALLLADDRSPMWTREEIEREMSSSPLAVSDALVALHACGLLHVHNDLVTTTRAARRMDELPL